MRRGYVERDRTEFGEKALPLLKKAGEEIAWLLNRNYPIKSVSTFVGNHHLLTERQRLALVRSISSQEALQIRKEKQRIQPLFGQCVSIDGFNQIITLEVALSQSTLLKCMDGTIRDLAGLRGSYRLIEQTDQAIGLIGEQLKRWEITAVCFYLDKPVSNSGRLKERILNILSGYDFQTSVQLVDNADIVLEKLDNVITSDAIILDKCLGWINLIEAIIENEWRDLSYIEIMKETQTAQT